VCTAAHQKSGVQAGGKFATVTLDVSDRVQVKTFLDKIPADLKEIDILGDFNLARRRYVANFLHPKSIMRASCSALNVLEISPRTTSKQCFRQMYSGSSQ